MVIVSKIDYCKIIDLGFETKSQALKAFKPYKSLPNETEDDYLKRVVPLVKNIIIKNEIDNFIKNEQDIRNDIINEMKIQLDFIYELKHKGENCVAIQGRYMKLEEKYNNLMRVLHAKEHVIRELDEEVDMLNNAINDLVNGTTKPNNSEHIMNLKTKKTNQCYECSICNEIIEKKETVYNICHMFHIKCITIWLMNNDKCPYCRNNLLT